MGNKPSHRQNSIHHTHIQRFAKAAGAGKEIHLSPIMQQFCNKHSFIHIVKVIGSNFFESINANRKFFLMPIPL